MSKDAYIHEALPGSPSAPLLFLFHGTGGDEHQLVSLGRELLPEAGTEAWYSVRKEPLPAQLVQVGRAHYAFAGQIAQAEIVKDEGLETAALVVQCGGAPVRVMCAPQADGTLPYGTWETRFAAGLGRLYGLVEEDFSVGVGERKQRAALFHARPVDSGRQFQVAHLEPRGTRIAHLEGIVLRLQVARGLPVARGAGN